jgi:transcriptional regulator with GAF, ATPase, and Fis domain
MSTTSDDVLRSAMADLARSAVNPLPIEQTLATVTATAVQLIDGVDSADVLLITDGEFRSAAPTSDVAPLIDQAQKRTGEGPCLDAAGADPIVRSSDLRAESRWPRFAAEAVAAGVHSVLSFQLFTHGADRGALNLFGFRPQVFSAEAETVSAMLASHAAAALVAANKQHQFESALASRDTIGQAKGMIMERFDVDAVRAFELLRKLSQDSNRPLHRLAEELISRGPDHRRDLRSP